MGHETDGSFGSGFCWPRFELVQVDRALHDDDDDDDDDDDVGGIGNRLEHSGRWRPFLSSLVVPNSVAITDEFRLARLYLDGEEID